MSRKIIWVALALIVLLWFTDGSLGGVTVESALIGWLFLASAGLCLS